MPPGPSTRKYSMIWNLENADLNYSADITWAPHMDWLSRQVRPEQITHRSRDVSVAASELQAAELDHRIAVVNEAMHSYERYAMSGREASDIYDYVLLKTYDSMRYEQDAVTKYIHEHEGASMGQGISWQNAIHVTSTQWIEIMGQIKESIAAMRSHPGWSNGLDFYPGMRARSNALPGFVDHTSGSISRSRIILFRPELSIWTLFLPDKKQWYRDIMDYVTERLDVVGEVSFPMVEGGVSYVKAQEYFREGRYQPFDGKSWEASIGQILTRVFNPFLVRTKNIYQLPSGVTVTSLLDTIAMVKVIAKRKGKFIILGDDCNSWGADDLSTPFLEAQLEDKATNFFLGLDYKEIEQPRISGFKVTVDRADKRKRIDTGLDDKTESWEGSHDEREAAVHAMLYLGLLEDGTLIDAIAKRAEIRGPGQMIEDIAHEVALKPNGSPFAPAERLGVKRLFLANA